MVDFSVTSFPDMTSVRFTALVRCSCWRRLSWCTCVAVESRMPQEIKLARGAGSSAP